MRVIQETKSGELPKKRWVVFSGTGKRPPFGGAVAQVKSLSQAKRIAREVTMRTGRRAFVGKIARLGKHYAMKFSGWGKQYYPEDITIFNWWNTGELR